MHSTGAYHVRIQAAVDAIGLQTGSREDMIRRLRLMRGDGLRMCVQVTRVEEAAIEERSPRDGKMFDSISAYIQAHPRLHEHILLFSVRPGHQSAIEVSKLYCLDDRV
jgi:hypothetical protein